MIALLQAAAAFWPTTAGGWATLLGAVLGWTAAVFGGVWATLKRPIIAEIEKVQKAVEAEQQARKDLSREIDAQIARLATQMQNLMGQTESLGLAQALLAQHVNHIANTVAEQAKQVARLIDMERDNAVEQAGQLGRIHARLSGIEAGVRVLTTLGKSVAPPHLEDA